MSKFIVYCGSQGQYRWRLVNDGGVMLAQSLDSFETYQKAEAAVGEFSKAASTQDVEVHKTEADEQAEAPSDESEQE